MRHFICFVSDICRRYNWFPECREAFGCVDICGRPLVPLEIKVLGHLRILGRGTCFDGISELSGVSEEIHRVFFHKFNRLFSEVFNRLLGLNLDT